jgi:hypothetical protein
VIPACKTVPDFNPTDQCSTGGITFYVPEGRTVYDGLLVKLEKQMSHHYQVVASYALQKLLAVGSGTSSPLDLDNYFATYGPVLPMHNLNVAGVVSLPYRFKLSVNSSIVTSTPVVPTISGIDLNASGMSPFPLSLAVPGLPYGCLAYSCGKAKLATAVALFNKMWAGKTAANGVKIPTLTLPAHYELGTPVFSQDFRIAKEFSYQERYKVQIFGEFFNAFNISNLTYSSFTLNSPSSFGQPSGRVGQSSTFGSGGPRAIQVGGRISF